MTDKTPGFWSSLPGILTGFAAVITALTGSYIAISSVAGPDTNPPEHVIPKPPSDNTVDDGKVKPEEIAAEEATDDTFMAVIDDQFDLSPASQKNPALIDCTLFPTVNSVTSLMSWSNYYHEQIITAKGEKNRAVTPCNKTIDYRGMAHCKAPNDPVVRQALSNTLTLCTKAGIDWTEIKHSSIIK